MFYSHGKPADLELIRVRFALSEGGRLEPVEMYLEGHPTLTGEMLRTIPLASMEAAANGHWRQMLLDSIGEAGAVVDKATDKWLTIIGGGHREHMLSIGADRAKQIRRQTLRLRIPQGHKRPDGFYARVAEMYLALTESGSRRPAPEIAEANDVPVSTVHRWIAEARRRELLPDGRQGKAG